MQLNGKYGNYLKSWRVQPPLPPTLYHLYVSVHGNGLQVCCRFKAHHWRKCRAAVEGYIQSIHLDQSLAAQEVWDGA